MAEHENYLWVERYKPHAISECILPQRIKDSLNEYVESGEIKNYIAVGPAGCGKTSSAMALLEQMDVQYLFINASSEGSIDTIRNKVTRFATTKSILSTYKVVVLDECLSEHEKVRIGTVDDWTPTALSELKHGVEYPIVSFNMYTGHFENDTGHIISDKEDELYEVELEDGSTVTLNAKHPFIVRTIDGTFVEKTIEVGLEIGDAIVKMSDTTTSMTTSKVKSIKKLDTRGRVINLTVHKNHTFITENGIVTHNCDYLSMNAQAALRGIMEQFYQNCRFILTANFGNRVLEPLKSRAPVIDFSFSKAEKKDMMKSFLPRVAGILDENDITYDKKELVKFCVTTFPDFRRTLNLLQRASVNGSLDFSLTSSVTDETITELCKYLVELDFDNMSKWVAENVDNDGHLVRRSLYDKLKPRLTNESIPSLIMILNDYDRYEVQVKDLEIHMKAMCITIMQECEFIT